jgi:hypothetical protein
LTGTREMVVGTAQAWLYHEDATLVLWECFLEAPYCQPDPVADTNLHALWRGFEDFLLARLPRPRRIVTPSWEPLYATEQWQQFLRLQGYGPLNRRAFVKAAPALDAVAQRNIPHTPSMPPDNQKEVNRLRPTPSIK